MKVVLLNLVIDVFFVVFNRIEDCSELFWLVRRSRGSLCLGVVSSEVSLLELVRLRVVDLVVFFGFLVKTAVWMNV